MTDHMVLAAKAQQKEWPGAKSAKFTTVKKHLTPYQPDNGPHPLFNMGGRKHYEDKRAPEWEFKPTRSAVKTIDHEKDPK